MRKLASIQRVAEVAPIEGADMIEKVRINGWWVVVKKGEFAVYERVVYFEIDSWIPHTLAPFLTKPGSKPHIYEGVEGERLRTVKLRGQLSQGLVLPLPTCIDAPDDGQDVTETLGVLLWERPMPESLRGVSRGSFPYFVRKTDQERIQNKMDVLKKLDTKYEVTLKLDGSSITIYHNKGEVGVCSRNQSLVLDERNTFVNIANKTGLFEHLTATGRNLAVQGELMGGKIQGNREGLSDYKIFVFDIYDIDAQAYLPAVERYNLVYSWVNDYLAHVPLLATAVTLGELKVSSLEDILSLADRPSLNHAVAEGVVFKAMDGSSSFKVINNNFLLREK